MTAAVARSPSSVPARRAARARGPWIIAGAVVAAGVWAGNPIATANPRGWVLVRRFFAGAISPDLDATFVELIARESLVTAAYAILGTTLAVAGGLGGAVLLSRRFWSRPTRLAAGPGWYLWRALAVAPRAVHEVVWALLLLNVLGIDPLVAVLAIGIPFGAITAKVYADAIDDADPGAFDAFRAAGAGRLAALVYGIGPQVRPELISYAFYRFECAIRSAAILGIVGAGGVGFQLHLSFTSLRYDQVWTAIYAIVLLEVMAEAWSRRVRPSPASADLAVGGTRGVGRRSSVALGVSIVAAWWWVDLDPSSVLSARTGREFLYLVGELWPPSLPDGWGSIVVQSLDTVALSILAIALAGVAAGVCAFLASTATRPRGAVGRVVSASVRAGLLLARAIPPPVWAIVVLFVSRPGPWTAALALAVYNIGVLGRLFGEAIDTADRSTMTALEGAGATRTTAIVYGLIPEVVRRFRSLGLYRWEVTIRDTVVVGVVGAGGLGRTIDESISSFAWSDVLGIIVALGAITVSVDFAAGRLRR